MARLKKPKKPATTFKPAPAAEAMAQAIIHDWHKHLLEQDVRVEFIFRSDTQKKAGQTVGATAQKVTSLAAFFGREPEQDKVKPFFAIVISEPIWCHMDANERRALLDHEICHLGCRVDNDGNTVLYIIPHDLEEFRAVVERHGYWQRSVKLMAASMENAPQTAMKLEELPEQFQELSSAYQPITSVTLPAGMGEKINEKLKEMGSSADAVGNYLKDAGFSDAARASIARSNTALQFSPTKWQDCPSCKGMMQLDAAPGTAKRYKCGCGHSQAVNSDG